MTDDLTKLVARAGFAVEELRAVLNEMACLRYQTVQAATPNRPKLNKREVTAIRAMSRSGETNRSIADIYQVNPATISRIVRGQYHK